MFDEILKEILTLKYFVLVVISSLILNIVASYLKNILDKGISKLNSSYKEKINLLKEEEKKFNTILIESEEFRNIHRDEAIFERIRSTWFLIFSVFIFTSVVIAQVNEKLILNEIYKYAIFLGFISLIISMKYIVSSTIKWNRAFSASNAHKSIKK